MEYVGSGTGEHTFPGQLAAQGCREPSAAWMTLDKPEQTEGNLERQRGSGALVLIAGLHNVVIQDYTSQHGSAM